MSQTPRAFVIPNPPDSWGVRDLLFVFGGSRSVVAQACLPQAGVACVLAFVGAGFTPPVGAKRRVFVL
jgi:hypothetical protein